ncbi:GNAT family N-acetyltransferase [Reinekea forsetii]|nr:GNAT family N-acetyltransferase [Reinekea forsetii]
MTLRPFKPSDAASVQCLAGEKVIADMTANIPHPYLDGMAEQWIANHETWAAQREAIVLAIQLDQSSDIIGAISITQIKGESGNLGYWLGVPFWGQGLCTEAASSLIDFGFNELGLNLIIARHLPENMASGKVMTKNGFEFKNRVTIGNRELCHYELKRSDWQASSVNVAS